MTSARWLAILRRAIKKRGPPKECCRCNATAKAIERVQAMWVVAGIGRD